jgi:hypothetical protein
MDERAIIPESEERNLARNLPAHGNSSKLIHARIGHENDRHSGFVDHPSQAKQGVIE